MDISRLVEGFLGGSGGSQAAGGALGGVAEAARGALSGGAGARLAGGALSGGAVALLLGNKKARKMGGKALKYGGIAALGGLAYLAYRNYKSGQAQPAGHAPQPVSDPRAIPAPPSDSGFECSLPDSQGHDLRLGLIQAMISAAKADGHIDATEHKAISDQIAAMDLAADEKAFLFDAMNAPSDPIAVASLARDEAQGAEIYLASLLTIDPDTAEEQRYMERLGDALRMPDGLRQELAHHAQSAKAGVEPL